MKTLKTIGKVLFKLFFSFFVFSFLLTCLYFINWISNKTCSYLRLIGFIVILYFVSNKNSRAIGKHSLLNGVLLGISIILLLFITALIIHYKIDFRLLIYYLLILGVTTLGSFRKKEINSEQS